MITYKKVRKYIDDILIQDFCSRMPNTINVTANYRKAKESHDAMCVWFTFDYDNVQKS